MSRLPTSLSLVAIVCGCVAPSTAPVYSADYDVGYNQGCQTAALGARERFRDDTLYKTNAAYKSGWNNGYGLCHNENANRNDPMRAILSDFDR
ncbi:MAG: hypothetical protein V6Z81_04310 [Parvularculales bacterium]